MVPELFQCADHLKYLSGPLKYLSGPRRTSYYFYRYSLTTFVDNRGAGFGNLCCSKYMYLVLANYIVGRDESGKIVVIEVNLFYRIDP